MPLPIEIFRAGDHTAMSGERLAFSEADLAASAAAYDPALHEAPLVVGHPEHDAPAYGWVRSLSAGDGALTALPDQVDAQFAELVTSGRFKKISASFYKPSAPNNPKPGVYYLRHVGFLGAAAPGVKGLKPVSFAGSDDDALTIEFGDFGERSAARLFRSLRDWVIGKFGQEDADAALPSWDVDAVQEAAVLPTSATPAPAFAEPVAPAAPVEPAPQNPTETVVQPAQSPQESAPVQSTEAAEREARLAERERELEARERELEARAQAQREEERLSYLEGLVAEGRPLPCEKSLLVSFMAALAGDGVVSFAEGETRSAEQLFRDEVLSRLPKRVEFSEVAPTTETAELDRDTLVDLTVAYQESQRAKGNVLTTTAAMQAVQRGARA